jgi:hypothetical protein
MVRHLFLVSIDQRGEFGDVNLSCLYMHHRSLFVVTGPEARLRDGTRGRSRSSEQLRACGTSSLQGLMDG